MDESRMRSHAFAKRRRTQMRRWSAEWRRAARELGAARRSVRSNFISPLDVEFIREATIVEGDSFQGARAKRQLRVVTYWGDGWDSADTGVTQLAAEVHIREYYDGDLDAVGDIDPDDIRTRIHRLGFEKEAHKLTEALASTLSNVKWGDSGFYSIDFDGLSTMRDHRALTPPPSVEMATVLSQLIDAARRFERLVNQ